MQSRFYNILLLKITGTEYLSMIFDKDISFEDFFGYNCIDTLIRNFYQIREVGKIEPNDKSLNSLFYQFSIVMFDFLVEFENLIQDVKDLRSEEEFLKYFYDQVSEGQVRILELLGTKNITGKNIMLQVPNFEIEEVPDNETIIKFFESNSFFVYKMKDVQGDGTLKICLEYLNKKKCEEVRWSDLEVDISSYNDLFEFDKDVPENSFTVKYSRDKQKQSNDKISSSSYKLSSGCSNTLNDFFLKNLLSFYIYQISSPLNFLERAKGVIIYYKNHNKQIGQFYFGDIKSQKDLSVFKNKLKEFNVLSISCNFYLLKINSDNEDKLRFYKSTQFNIDNNFMPGVKAYADSYYGNKKFDFYINSNYFKPLNLTQFTYDSRYENKGYHKLYNHNFCFICRVTNFENTYITNDQRRDGLITSFFENTEFPFQLSKLKEKNFRLSTIFSVCKTGNLENVLNMQLMKHKKFYSHKGLVKLFNKPNFVYRKICSVFDSVKFRSNVTTTFENFYEILQRSDEVIDDLSRVFLQENKNNYYEMLKSNEILRSCLMEFCNDSESDKNIYDLVRKHKLNFVLLDIFEDFLADELNILYHYDFYDRIHWSYSSFVSTKTQESIIQLCLNSSAKMKNEIDYEKLVSVLNIFIDEKELSFEKDVLVFNEFVEFILYNKNEVSEVVINSLKNDEVDEVIVCGILSNFESNNKRFNEAFSKIRHQVVGEKYLSFYV